jgi:hypothetical protein
MNFDLPIADLGPEELPGLVRQAEQQRDDVTATAKESVVENLDYFAAEVRRVYGALTKQLKARMAKAEAIA